MDLDALHVHCLLVLRKKTQMYSNSLCCRHETAIVSVPADTVLNSLPSPDLHYVIILLRVFNAGWNPVWFTLKVPEQ